MDITSKFNKEFVKIEDFKALLQGRAGFTSEERLVILNAFAIVTLSQSSLMPDSVPLNPQLQPSSNHSISLISETFAELVRRTKVRQHTDLILLAAYYQAVFKKVNSVTTVDIQQLYTSAMLKLSTNTNANINVNRRKGYMTESDKKEGKKTFAITRSGISYINEILKANE